MRKKKRKQSSNIEHRHKVLPEVTINLEIHKNHPGKVILNLQDSRHKFNLCQWDFYPMSEENADECGRILNEIDRIGSLTSRAEIWRQILAIGGNMKMGTVNMELVGLMGGLAGFRMEIILGHDMSPDEAHKQLTAVADKIYELEDHEKILDYLSNLPGCNHTSRPSKPSWG